MSDLRDQVVRVRDDLQSLANHCRITAADEYSRGLIEGGRLAYATAAAKLTAILEDDKPVEWHEAEADAVDAEDPPSDEEPQRFDPMQWKNHTSPKVGTATTLVRTPQWGDYL